MLQVILKNTVGKESSWFWAAVQAVGIIVTLFYIGRQVRIGRLGLMLDSLDRLERKWRSLQMAKARCFLCDEYNDPVRKLTTSLDPNSNIILMFFEELGGLVNHGLLSRGMVWHRLSYPIEYYWALLERRVVQDRIESKDTQLYVSFQSLHKAMLKITKRRVGKHAVVKTDHDLAVYANHELTSVKRMIEVSESRSSSKSH